MTDQCVALISREHADSLVWQKEAAEGLCGFEDDSDRIVSFEVCQKEEQEDNAVSNPGFTVCSIALHLYLLSNSHLL